MSSELDGAGVAIKLPEPPKPGEGEDDALSNESLHKAGVAQMEALERRLSGASAIESESDDTKPDTKPDTKTDEGAGEGDLSLDDPGVDDDTKTDIEGDDNKDEDGADDDDDIKLEEGDEDGNWLNDLPDELEGVDAQGNRRVIPKAAVESLFNNFEFFQGIAQAFSSQDKQQGLEMVAQMMGIGREEMPDLPTEDDFNQSKVRQAVMSEFGFDDEEIKEEPHKGKLVDREVRDRIQEARQKLVEAQQAEENKRRRAIQQVSQHHSRIREDVNKVAGRVDFTAIGGKKRDEFLQNVVTSMAMQDIDSENGETPKEAVLRHAKALRSYVKNLSVADAVRNRSAQGKGGKGSKAALTSSTNDKGMHSGSARRNLNLDDSSAKVSAFRQELARAFGEQ